MEPAPMILEPGQGYRGAHTCQSKYLRVINQPHTWLPRICYNLQFWQVNNYNDNMKMFSYGWKTAKYKRWQHLITIVTVWVQYWLADDCGWVIKICRANTYPIYLAHKILPSFQQSYQLRCLIQTCIICVLLAKMIKEIKK